tara:strand:+ start:639 stop:938 length:300 start_codon:yes stop_codon:yes gene_type:complete
MKKFKKHTIIAWVWGLAMAFVSGTPMNITLIEFIIQPPLFGMFLLVPPLLLSYIISFFVKNDEKEMKIFDVLFYVMLALGIFGIISTAWVDYMLASNSF